MRDSATFSLFGNLGDGGYLTALIVPAAIFLLGALFATAILMATRKRQGSDDSKPGTGADRLESDREVLAKMLVVLKRAHTPDTVEKNFEELLHFAWMLADPAHAGLSRKIRDFDRSQFADFGTAEKEMKRLQDEITVYLS